MVLTNKKAFTEPDSTNVPLMEFHQSFAQAGTLGVLSVCAATIMIRLRNKRELSSAGKVHVNVGLSST
jgi:hypothetical protein